MKALTLRALRGLDDRIHGLSRGDRRRVLFDGESLMHFAMFETLTRALGLDDRIECRFTCSWDGGLKVPLADVCRVLGLAPSAFTPYAQAKWKKWDLFISSCFDNPWFARNVPWADTFHGVGEKWVDGGERLYMCHPLAARYDRLLCPNRRLAMQFEKHPAFLKSPQSLRVTGLARSDLLVWLNSPDIRAALKGALGLQPDDRVVLFAPTWGREGLLARHAEDAIRACRDAGCQLLVKLHSCSYLADPAHNGGVDWRSRMEEWSASYGFRHLPEANLVALMLAADAMVADFGSAPVEFCVLDRPLIFFNVPEQATRTGGDGFQFNALCAAGDAVTDIRGLASALTRALAGNDRTALPRQRLREDFFHEPGAATENSLVELYGMMSLEFPGDLGQRCRQNTITSVLSAPHAFIGCEN